MEMCISRYRALLPRTLTELRYCFPLNHHASRRFGGNHRLLCLQKVTNSSVSAETQSDVHTSSQQGGLSAEDARLFKAALENRSDQSSNIKASENIKGSKMIGEKGVGNKAGELLLGFTCCKCNTRAVKRFSKHSYEKGIVIVQCPGCKGHHLIADNLGWFSNTAADGSKNSENNNVERWLKEANQEEVQRLTADNLLDVQ